MELHQCDIVFSFMLDIENQLQALLVAHQELPFEQLYSYFEHKTTESKSYMILLYSIKVIITMKIFSKYLQGRTKRKATAKIRKTLFYSITLFLTCLIVSKQIDCGLYYIMDNNKPTKTLIKKNKYLIEGNYKPTAFLYFGILQDFYFKYLATKIFLRYEEEQSTDCSIIRVPFSHQKKDAQLSQIPCVFVISSSQGFDHNMTEAMLRVHNSRFDVIGIVPKDFCSEKKLVSEIQKVKQSKGVRKYYAIGMQYGANLMVNAAAMQASLFDGMISIANPLQLSIAEQQVDSSWSAKQIFLQDMINGRLRLLNKQKQQCLKSYDVDKLLYQISDQKLPKWKQQHSSLYSLPKLKTPCLFIQSQADPMCISFKKQEITEDLESNPKCIFIETRHGGHNIWYESLNALNWSFLVAVQHIRTLDSQLKKNPKFFEF